MPPHNKKERKKKHFHCVSSLVTLPVLTLTLSLSPLCISVSIFLSLSLAPLLSLHTGTRSYTASGFDTRRFDLHEVLTCASLHRRIFVWWCGVFCAVSV